jgi:hypothetical protein
VRECRKEGGFEEEGRIRENCREETNTSFSEPSIAEILGGLNTNEY